MKLALLLALGLAQLVNVLPATQADQAAPPPPNQIDFSPDHPESSFKAQAIGADIECVYHVDAVENHQVIVHGHNPQHGRQTHVVRVMVFSQGPQVASEVQQTLTLPAEADASMTIPISAVTPGCRIHVSVEYPKQFASDAPTAEQTAKAPGTLHLGDRTFSVHVLMNVTGGGAANAHHATLAAISVNADDQGSPVNLASAHVWTLEGESLCAKPTLTFNDPTPLPEVNTGNSDKYRLSAVAVDFVDGDGRHHLVTVKDGITRIHNFR